MRKTLAILISVLALCGGIAFASGSSGGGVSTANNPQQVSETLKCVITAVNADGSLTMRDLETEKLSRVAIDGKVKITAENKAEFDGRKKLNFEDLAEGQVVKVTMKIADGRILKIRVLESA